MKTLVAGYIAPEFGWGLFGWQGILRHQAKKGNYDKVIIGCEPQYRFLYEDFATDFVNFPFSIKTRNMWYTNGQVYPMPKADIVPSRELCRDESIPQDFVSWGKYKEDYKFDILIHARSTNNMNTYYRNWPLQYWCELVSQFKGLNIACLGTTGGAFRIPGTVDIRGIELKQLADVIFSSSMLVSPSSGPAHFASLCETIHIVWSDFDTVGVMNNKIRYLKKWNPFNTECCFIPSWQPTIKQVADKIEDWL